MKKPLKIQPHPLGFSHTFFTIMKKIEQENRLISVY